MKRATLNHPKLHRLMDLLAINRREALGLLTLLWDFTGEYATDGAVGRLTDEAIARGVDWDTRGALQLVSALTTAGWLDEVEGENRLVVHDWPEHCERYIKQRLERQGRSFATGGRAKRTTKTDDQSGRAKRPPKRTTKTAESERLPQAAPSQAKPPQADAARVPETEQSTATTTEGGDFFEDWKGSGLTEDEERLVGRFEAWLDDQDPVEIDGAWVEPDELWEKIMPICLTTDWRDVRSALRYATSIIQRCQRDQVWPTGGNTQQSDQVPTGAQVKLPGDPE